MTHITSQWKIRLLSLMVAASVFTGGMATLAEPADAKKKSSHSKKKKKSKSNNGNFEGAQASTKVDKEIDQSAEQENNSNQTNNQNQTTTQTNENNPVIVNAPIVVCPTLNISDNIVNLVQILSGNTTGGGLSQPGADCSGNGTSNTPTQTNTTGDGPTNTPSNTQTNTNTPTASQDDLGSNNSGAASL